MKPFARLLRTYPGIPEEVIAPIDGFDPETRLPIETVHELLRGTIVMTGDEDIGLKAAELIERGDYGALEYAGSTARTNAEAFELIGRYMRLINDALSFSIRTDGEQAVIELESAVVLPRAAEDFEVAAFYVASKPHVPDETPPFEVRFQHAQPANTQLYTRVFSERATVRFDQPVAGFAFPRELLARPLPSADPKLHAVIRQHAERLLAELPKAESMTARVRELLMDGLPSGKASADHIANALHVSASTLTRRLEREGTNFKALHDDLRRSLALRYVAESDLSLAEIAFLLGFSQTAAFHRAFKRWTERTPLEYRNAHRG
jgi:AraC-like DNA-binding protein